MPRPKKVETPTQYTGTPAKLVTEIAADVAAKLKDAGTAAEGIKNGKDGISSTVVKDAVAKIDAVVNSPELKLLRNFVK